MGTAALKSELERLRSAATAHKAESPVPAGPSTAAADTAALACELTQALRRSVEHYREAYGLSLPEAVARAEERHPEYEEMLLHRPPDELTFGDLNTLYKRDPECFIRRWREVREAARQERRSGHHGARLVEGWCGRAWERAHFLALRDELAEAWRPRDAQDWLLIDQLAQFQTAMERWQDTLANYSHLWGGRGKSQKEDERDLPRLSIAEAVDQAAAMMERMHRLCLRTMKALQDRRRYAPPVVVRRAGQVNVGAQQVNVAGG